MYARATFLALYAAAPAVGAYDICWPQVFQVTEYASDFLSSGRTQQTQAYTAMDQPNGLTLMRDNIEYDGPNGTKLDTFYENLYQHKASPPRMFHIFSHRASGYMNCTVHNIPANFPQPCLARNATLLGPIEIGAGWYADRYQAGTGRVGPTPPGPAPPGPTPGPTPVAAFAEYIHVQQNTDIPISLTRLMHRYIHNQTYGFTDLHQYFNYKNQAPASIFTPPSICPSSSDEPALTWEEVRALSPPTFNSFYRTEEEP